MLEKNKSIRRDKVQAKNCIYYVYVFRCIDCDNEIRAQSSHLKTHSGKCVRCGQKGIPYKHIYNELFYHHNKKTYFNLSFDEFLELIETKKCNYCEEDIKFNPHTRDENSVSCSRAYQLDRKDNNFGYVKDNLVVCCWECNRLKSNRFSYEEFMEIAPVMKNIMLKRKNK